MMRFLRSGAAAVILAVLCLVTMGLLQAGLAGHSGRSDLNLQAVGLTAREVAAPDGEESEWSTWYKLSFILHNGGQEGVELGTYQFTYQLQGKDGDVYHYQGDGDAVLEYRPWLPAGRSCTVTQLIEVYGNEPGGTLAVSYDSWQDQVELGEVTLPGA